MAVASAFRISSPILWPRHFARVRGKDAHSDESMTDAVPLDNDTRPSMKRAIGIALVMLAIILGQLTMRRFDNDEEMVNVATALELKRDGHWKMPTLCGQPRDVKPPLTAWVTTAFLSLDTNEAAWSDNPTTAQFNRVLRLYQARLPTALGMAAAVGALYLLGTCVGGQKLGVIAAILCGSNLLFLRHTVLATTDAMLTIWVTLANAALAYALFRGNQWTAMTVAGVALGLALMSKGPLALIQSVLPFVIFVSIGARKLTIARGSKPAVVWAALLAVVIGLAWYVWIAASTPGIVKTWMEEVTRTKSDDIHPDAVYRYFTVTRFWLPALPLLIWGLRMTIGDWVATKKLSRHVLPMLLFIVPLAIMICFSERKDRYLVPLIPAMCLIAARPLVDVMKSRAAWAWLTSIAFALIVGNAIYTAIDSRNNTRADTHHLAAAARKAFPADVYHLGPREGFRLDPR